MKNIQSPLMRPEGVPRVVPRALHDIQIGDECCGDVGLAARAGNFI